MQFFENLDRITIVSFSMVAVAMKHEAGAAALRQASECLRLLTFTISPLLYTVAFIHKGIK